MFGALGRAYPKADWAPRFLRAKSTFQALARDAVGAYFHGVSILRDDMRKQLFSARFRASLGGYDAIEVFRRHAALADTSLADGARRTREIVTRTVGAEYAADVTVRETATLGHPSVEVRVAAPLPLVGLLGAPRLMEVTAHAPVESLD